MYSMYACTCINVHDSNMCYCVQIEFYITYYLCLVCLVLNCVCSVKCYIRTLSGFQPAGRERRKQKNGNCGTQTQGV